MPPFFSWNHFLCPYKLVPETETAKGERDKFLDQPQISRE